MPQSDQRKHEAEAEQQAQGAGGPEGREGEEAHEQAARYASRDVGGLQEAHPAGGLPRVVLHRALQGREGKSHQESGRAEEEQGQEQVEARQTRRVLGAAQVNQVAGRRSSSGRTIPGAGVVGGSQARAPRARADRLEEGALGEEEDAQRARSIRGATRAPTRLPAAEPRR